MKTASISELKKELQTLAPAQLAELCTRLAKYKKENKELLGYLLFEAQDEAAFIREVKQEVEQQFAEMNSTNVYYAKKSIRKILRMVNKYSKYSGIPQTGIELLIHFCQELKASGVPLRQSNALLNLYENQLKKITKLLYSLHEDLQYDYQKELDKL
jgi:hypothetical protein